MLTSVFHIVYPAVKLACLVSSQVQGEMGCTNSTMSSSQQQYAALKFCLSFANDAQKIFYKTRDSILSRNLCVTFPLAILDLTALIGTELIKS